MFCLCFDNYEIPVEFPKNVLATSSSKYSHPDARDLSSFGSNAKLHERHILIHGLLPSHGGLQNLTMGTGLGVDRLYGNSLGNLLTVIPT